jgi:hypothetical protein
MSITARPSGSFRGIIYVRQETNDLAIEAPTSVIEELARQLIFKYAASQEL